MSSAGTESEIRLSHKAHDKRLQNNSHQVNVAKNIQGIENFDNVFYGTNDLAEQEILELRILK